MKKEKRLLLCLVLVLVGALLFGSVAASGGDDPGDRTSLEGARKALERELSALVGAGFVGIAASEIEGEVIVFVEDELTAQAVPPSIKCYAVRTEVTGKIQAFATEVVEALTEVSAERQGEVSPLVGGVSLSAYVRRGIGIHPYAGTLGMITYDNKILSNAHVIATNPDTGDFLDIGTPVIQPGSYDGGTLNDQVGALEAYIPIDFASGAKNYADAAIASIDVGIEASAGEQFYEGGNHWVEGWTEVSKGDIVRKSGCLTGVTTGQVIHTNVSVEVWYGDRSAYFADQIVVTQENWSFAAPGDSGSAVDKDGEFVGLLFAGSERSAVISKAEHIIDGLGIAVEPLEGQYGLTVTSSPGGSVIEPGEGMSLRSAGEVVALVAVADEHWHFLEWTGDVTAVANVTASETTITMNDSYSITAIFEIDEGWCSLTTSSAEGGSVVVPGEGTFIYPANSNATILAQADVGSHYHFVEWTGDVATIADPQAASTNITMYDSYSITANFELDAGWNSLTVAKTSGGSIIEPGQGTFVYEDGVIVDLIAQPDEGYEFVKWTGDVDNIADSQAAATNITMDGSYSITANFESWHPDPVALLTVSSTVGGSVISPGQGIFDCTLGSMVILMAEANDGYQFSGWSGEVDTIADVDAATTTITMDSSYSIRADFQTTTSSPCCTATAAFGTPMAKEIGILRQFRDQYLLTNLPGQMLADFYYGLGPPIAEFINEHPSLKPVVRAGLAPAVAVSTIIVNTSPAGKAAIVGLLVLSSVALLVLATGRRDKRLRRARS
jgi:hypothetical protein